MNFDELYNEKGFLMDESAVARTITRIAHEILEKNKGTENLVLVGILRRGVPLANRIAKKIKEIEGVDVPVESLDISFYRDDLSTKDRNPVIHDKKMNVSLEGKSVVLVDDVIFTGRTVRAAIEGVFAHGRPACIRLAVLVDRGLRELPIRPDYIGKNIPSSHLEMVRVCLSEIDGEDSVRIYIRKTENPIV